MSKKKTVSNSLPLFDGLDLAVLHPVETITVEQAEKYVFDSVDFSDPARSKTCLEVDFPILKVNEISAIEQNATKPIYMMSKWWARRRASVFRQLLISAATKAPKDEKSAAQASWGLMYRKNHQGHGKFSKLNVVDIFMGGGTTVVEAARLGFNVTGIDLNPIAWWVVHNEVNPVKPERIAAFLKYIEQKVKPEILPFYTTRSPWGFSGKVLDAKTGQPQEIDLLDIPLKDRNKFDWSGPEVIYTFWMKHIMCADPSCYHLTPQTDSETITEKTLKIKFLENCVCPHCGDVFDLEFGNFRLAPSSKIVIAEEEKPFAPMDHNNKAKCPHCKKELNKEWVSKQEIAKGKPVTKAVTHSLIINKNWLKGITANGKDYFGGHHGSSQLQDELWFKERSTNLELIEVRGNIPAKYQHTNFGRKVKKADSDEDQSAQSSGQIICGKCGRQQDPLGSIKLSGHLARIFPYAIQCFDPEAKARKLPYNGRFFDVPDLKQIQKCFEEFSTRKDVSSYVPQDALFYGYKTHFWAIPDHGYTHWYKMFTPRQLYTNALILKVINEATEFTNLEKSHLLGAWQNYVRNNNIFCFWNPQRDTPEPHFSSNNYHPKATFVENGVFSDLGRGNFTSCVNNVADGVHYATKPYDLMVNNTGEGGKSIQIPSEDIVSPKNVTLACQSSTDLKNLIKDGTVDMVITDPPFGDNVNYAELADFFMVWLHGPLSKIFPNVFSKSESPKALEAVTNKARHPGKSEDGMTKADYMYDRLLTMCWKEAYRILKVNGLMAFTFHHDKDIAWLGVLESLFKAGFTIEATFPVRSDAKKGDGHVGAQKIEFDIVHVCKKRSGETKEIYWASLRKKILESVKAKSAILAQHREAGLHLADIEVIIRGEVLEQYSSHYGKVKKNLAGELMSVKEILIEANSIAQSLLQEDKQEKLPELLEPQTRVFLSLFRDGPSIEFNAAQKRLKGAGIGVDEFKKQGWIQTIKEEGQRILKLQSIPERWGSLSRRSGMDSDLDQAHFAINCCLGGKQLNGKAADLEAWTMEHYRSIQPSVVPLLKYMESNHFGSDFKQAIGTAYRTLERTLAKIKETDGDFRKASEQLNLI